MRERRTIREGADGLATEVSEAQAVLEGGITDVTLVLRGDAPRLVARGVALN